MKAAHITEAGAPCNEVVWETYITYVMHSHLLSVTKV